MTRPVHLIGLPTDRHSSFCRGPAAAPARIRAALASDMGNAAAELDDRFERIGLTDCGDLPLLEQDGDDALIADAAAAACASGATPLLLGGDHSVTLPILRGIARHHGPVAILHFDAHPDLYDELLGDRRSHASPFARIMEEGLCHDLLQVGLRTINDHQRAQATRFGVRQVPMRGFSLDAVALPNGPVYVSLDLDALDPAFAPGVSHHEPGGLSVREVIALLDRIEGPVIGADIVEYNPTRDVGAMTAAVAAKFVKELAALMIRTGG